MKQQQKEEIKTLRQNGLGYKRIATMLSLSTNTVKSYCRRAGIEKESCSEVGGCRYCGKTIQQIKGRKQKYYCSDACRMKWWNLNLDKVNRQSYTEHRCHYCGRVFKSYANKKRKFCQHECYIKSRFGD